MEKMIRKQENSEWPATVEAVITSVSGKNFGDPSRYMLNGIGADAKSLCPKSSYATKAALVKAAEKLGWELGND